MEQRRIRWGILGCAGIADSQFVPALQMADGVELTAVASRGLSKAQQFARKHGALRAYGSYEELLADREVEAIYIPLPNHLHKEWTVKAAQAGKHVLCEKPLALDETECQEMIEACQQQGVLLMEAFMYRFHPQMARVKEIVASGEIGNVKMAHATFSFMLTDPNNVRMNPKWGGGATMDVGCYPINFFRYLFEGEPVKVSAFANFNGSEGIDLTLTGMLQFAQGKLGYFDCSFAACDRQVVEVIGEQGKIEIMRPWRPDNDRVSIKVTIGGQVRKEGFEPHNPYKLEIEHFSQCITTNQQPLLTGTSGKQNVQVISALLKSAQTGAVVRLI